MQAHDYVSINSELEEAECKDRTEEILTPNRDAKPTETHSGAAKKDSDDVPPDPAWQKPITLKMLKKKLYEVFTKK